MSNDPVEEMYKEMKLIVIDEVRTFKLQKKENKLKEHEHKEMIKFVQFLERRIYAFKHFRPDEVRTALLNSDHYRKIFMAIDQFWGLQTHTEEREWAKYAIHAINKLTEDVPANAYDNSEFWKTIDHWRKELIVAMREIYKLLMFEELEEKKRKAA
ncbi:MAG: hypothetical protein ABIH34_05010 [Nanoarchaeota archaeon]